MEYSDVIKDFALRTKKNLEFIDQAHANGQNVYEFTQLINSLLGLIVFPQQKLFLSIPEIPLEELEKQGWPVPKVRGDYPNVRHLRDLFRFLRNGIAHFNIKFRANHGDLVGIIIWNNRTIEDPVTGKKFQKKTWQAEIGAEDLRRLALKFIDLILAT